VATNKPRITITLEPDVYATLRELAALQGRSLSSLVAEQMGLLHPVQQKVLAAMRNVLAVEQEAKQDLADRLDSAQAQAEASIGPLLALLEGFAGAAQPPHSNTGVTHPNDQTVHGAKKPSKPRKSRAPASTPSKPEEGGQ